MIKLNIYLNFKGNAEEAFNFYKSVFGGEFAMLQRMKDVPKGEYSPAPKPEYAEKIMHIALPIGENVLMGSDSIEEMGGGPLKVGDNFNLSINVDSKEKADEIWRKLSVGGTVQMPLSKTFWSEYFGMLMDKFGVWWMISCDKK